MPEDFLKCVMMDGEVRTEKLKGGKYRHVCYLKGKRYVGEIKTKKNKS